MPKSHRHRLDYIEDDIKHKKKKHHTTKKANHKHQYEWILSYGQPDTKYVFACYFGNRKNKSYFRRLERDIYLFQKCKICGNIRNTSFFVNVNDKNYVNAHEECQGIKEYINNNIVK